MHRALQMIQAEPAGATVCLIPLTGRLVFLELNKKERKREGERDAAR